MKAWCFSDTHGGFGSRHIPEADVAIVAGDVREGLCDTIEWLAATVRRHMPVVFVAGNHAIYGKMRRGSDAIGRLGHVPSCFSGLVPEGGLRQLVENELGPGKHGEATVLARLGADLPGAVVVTVADEEPRPAREHAPEESRIHFSLAGDQMKLSASLASAFAEPRSRT